MKRFDWYFIMVCILVIIGIVASVVVGFKILGSPNIPWWVKVWLLK